MTVYRIDPLTDGRWDALLQWHPHAGVFHSRGWLTSLRNTYGFNPVAFSTSGPDGLLESAILFCEITSWLTGRRLVSLPFSDHCDPLITSPGEHAELLAHVHEHIRHTSCNFAEFRPLTVTAPDEAMAAHLSPSEALYLHVMPLDPPAEDLFKGFHKDCIQRKIRRAEREGLQYERGRSESMLRQFYALLVQTRRRHALPPQPLEWFHQLTAAFQDQLVIRVASKDHRPVAALLTLSFKRTITYKYGCSDEQSTRLGGTPFLFWKTIQEAKAGGADTLDLGRSELENAGLITFKDRLGAARIPLTRYRILNAAPRRPQGGIVRELAGQVLRRMPRPLLVATGRALYRHFG